MIFIIDSVAMSPTSALAISVKNALIAALMLHPDGQAREPAPCLQAALHTGGSGQRGRYHDVHLAISAFR